MLTRKTRLALWFATLALVMACAPVFSAAPAVPTLDPNAINQIIVQTANAASTQTVAALPTSTGTNTPTRTPTSTRTEGPTATNTVIYEFQTPTPFTLPTIVGTFKPTSDKDYACETLDSPVDGTYYSPRLEFKVRWRLKNVGHKEWVNGIVDFSYDTGDKFYKVREYSLGDDIKPGQVVEIFVELRAPKDSGTYTAYWSLRLDTYKFCRVAFTIKVR